MAEDPKATQPVQTDGQPDNKTETTVPPTPPGGQTKTTEAAPLDPSLQGKSTEELVKMYGELSKKIGEQSGELGELRKYKGQMDTVLQAIYSKPDTLYKDVEAAIQEVTGQKPADSTTTPKAEDKKEPVVDTDTRKAVEASIISAFETQYGIDRLPPDQRKDMMVKIGNSLANMVDPGGNKSYNDILNSISLQKLPAMLKNSYLIANADAIVEKARLDGQKRAAESGVIGSIPSSSIPSEEVTLTPEEREVARKMNVSEENYLKNKKEILSRAG